MYKELSPEDRQIFEEISDEELFSLECPTFDEQEDAWKRTIDQITRPRIESLLNSIDYELVDWNHFDESKGIINKIYMIKARKKDHDSNEELVLRIYNPHRFWRNLRSQNEASLLKYLNKSTKIPVPKVLSHSSDRSTSLLGCEYLLMNRIPGVLLDDITDNLEKLSDLPDKVIEQILSHVKELLHISPPNMDKNLIGYLDSDLKITQSTQERCAVKPCRTFLEYIDIQLKWCVKEMKKMSRYAKLANELDQMRQDLINTANENPDVDELNFGDEMTVFHGDLNATNILIDPISLDITGIIDWDFSMHGYEVDEGQLRFISDWFKDESEEEISKQFNEYHSPIKDELVEWFEKTQKGSRYRQFLLNLASNACQIVFYSSTWLKEDYEDPILGIRLHIRKSAEELRNNFKDWPEFMDELKNYRKN